jgi:hypothetical protein
VNLLDAAADHHLDQTIHGRGGNGLGPHLAPVAKNGDAIANLEHFVEAVGDKEYRDAAFGQTPHNREQGTHLFVGQCRGWLVENQDFDVLGKRLRDFDDLPFARGQLSHAGVRSSRPSARTGFLRCRTSRRGQ